MNKRHYEHTLPNIRGSLSNTYEKPEWLTMDKILEYSKRMIAQEE
jgi:hypothetical protein